MAARSARCVILAFVFVAGCAEPEAVRVLDEPKAERPPPREIPADQKTFRTLAAMVPGDAMREAGPHWWFFKLSGPAALVAKYEDDFDKIFDTVRSTANPEDPITWELPPGWKAEKVETGFRHATLKPPAGDAEVAVSRAGGHVLTNAQRWWGQLWGKDKEPEITTANLPDYLAQRTARGRIVLRADMYGPNDPNARPMMKNPHGGQ
jgi:hypothetical protein